jgi:hypothetical protein
MPLTKLALYKVRDSRDSPLPFLAQSVVDLPPPFVPHVGRKCFGAHERF